jgi:hypothetical protein
MVKMKQQQQVICLRGLLDEWGHLCKFVWLKLSSLGPLTHLYLTLSRGVVYRIATDGLTV